jgi:transposase-like protein
MIHVNLKCHHCGKNLMDQDFKIDGHPSVKVHIEYKGKWYELRLSSRYGSYGIKTDAPVQSGEIVKFGCPHCNADIMSSRLCYECKAPMVTFESELGGYLRICSRKGCKKHVIEFENLETEMRAFYEKYSTYFKGDAGHDK